MAPVDVGHFGYMIEGISEAVVMDNEEKCNPCFKKKMSSRISTMLTVSGMWKDSLCTKLMLEIQALNLIQHHEFHVKQDNNFHEPSVS